MNIKSLLLGSAVAAVAATGARAADAIIIAEPEPMEYVRICDTYGVGFFYIPGTETCLRIGGLVRHEQRYTNYDFADETYGSFTRFQLNVDARNETEWGTLRSYAEARFDFNSVSGNTAYLNQGFIEISNPTGIFRLGKTDVAYARFLGYGSPFGPFDGYYGFDNANEVSYTFVNGAFSGIIAARDLNGDDKFDFGIEGGLRYSEGWGNVGAMVGYDTNVEEWGAKGVANVNFGDFSLGGHVYYSSAANSAYQIRSGIFSAGVDSASEWAALVYGTARLTDTLSASLAFEWYDAQYAFAVDHVYEITAGLDWRPISGFRIQPEIQYGKLDAAAGFANEDRWRSTIRFQRSF